MPLRSALLALLGACAPMTFESDAKAGDTAVPDTESDTDTDADSDTDTDTDADTDTDTDTDTAADTDTGRPVDTAPVDTAPVDADADGWLSDEDCDDADPAVHPDAEEVCADGVDNNCDGSGEPCTLEGGTSLSDADARLVGAAPGETAGQVVGGLGDADGDGLVDLFVTGPELADAVRGVVHVIHGAPSGDVDLGTADAHVRGVEPGDRVGQSAAGAGDLDGDGLGDLLVGAMSVSGAGGKAGAVYLVRAPFVGEIDVSAAAYATWYGEDDGDWVGIGVASLGDVTGDGIPDALAGGVAAGDIDQGGAWILDGARTGDQSVADATATFLGTSVGDAVGGTVASGGDLDGDGLRDVLVGSYQIDVGRGAVWFYAGPSAGTYGLGDADAEFHGAMVGDCAAAAMTVVDVDGDGQDDLVMGSTGHDGGARNGGSVHVFFGPVAGRETVSGAGHQVAGAREGGGFGSSVAAEDLDGDGLVDLVVGAGSLDGGYGGYEGAVYLVRGPITATTSGMDAAARWLGEGSGDYAGSALALPGDLDGDGWGDLLVGASGFDGTGIATGGAAYVLYGGGL